MCIYINMISARGPKTVFKQLLCRCNWGALGQLLRLLGVPCQTTNPWISLLNPFRSRCTFYVHLLLSQQLEMSV